MMLMDVGAWFALVYEAQPRHRAVREWKHRTEYALVLCRVTQMSLLRLLTNQAAMGDDVLTRATAWTVVDRLRADTQVTWSSEPPGLEQLWRSFSARDDVSHKLWTDDYLAAFAMAGGMGFVTLDRQVAGRYPSIEVVTIG